MKVPVAAVLLFAPALVWAQSIQPPAVSAGDSQVQQPPSAPPATSPGLSQPGYLLGPGDTLKVNVWTGNEYVQDTLTMAPDGTLFIPFYVNKLVKASGLTAAQLRDLIQSELDQIFQQPIVQLITVGFESQKAFLVGETTTAGQFPIFGNTRILDFVVQHGGFTPRANLAAVQVTRAGAAQLSVNVLDIVLKGDQSQNLVVMPGDIVFVPSLETVSKRYFVLGEVRAPQMVQSPQDLNLLEALSRAGTVAPTGEASRIFVVRQNPEGSEVKEIKFSDIYRTGDLSRNIPLQSGDIVYVPKNRRTRVNDVLSAITPLMNFIRDSALFLDIVRGRR
ncbi:MAG: polysaccharide biosynthesis/export family protein [Acidobacteria bacterium]|nr:polysaccharide biosynthesis/export family protein [Acidobacteriota bacterium]